MNKKLTAVVASVPDRDNVVYEIYYGRDQVVEISNELESGLQIEIFAPHDGGSWQLNFNEFRELIEQAEKNIS